MIESLHSGLNMTSGNQMKIVDSFDYGLVQQDVLYQVPNRREAEEGRIDEYKELGFIDEHQIDNS